MNLAITGGSGFLGKWFLKDYAEKMNRITVLGRQQHRQLTGCRYIQTNYDIEHLRRVLSESQIDAVLHMAATRLQKDTCRLDYSTYLGNTQLSQRIFEACHLCGISNVVQTSTIGVYGNNPHVPWREHDVLMPCNPYALSKAASDELAHYYNTTTKLKIKSLRIAQVVGYGERPGFMLQTFIDNALKKEPIYITGNLNDKREYIYVRDVTSALYHSLGRHVCKGVHNVGSGIALNSEELAHLVSDTFRSVAIDTSQSYNGPSVVSLMNSDRMCRDMRWWPRWELSEGLQEIKACAISAGLPDDA